MKLLTTIYRWVRKLSGLEDDGFSGPRGMGKTKTGVRVDEEIALTYSAVWCATRIIAETTASLPLILYRRLPKGGKTRDTQHPLYKILHDQPNTIMDSMSFWECLLAWLVNWGNAYAEIERDNGGRILHLWPIHPSRVTIEKTAAGILYHVRSDKGERRTLAAYRMFHITGLLSDDGVTGKGVIRQARESIGMGLATEQYGAAFFGNGGKPQSVLTHPKTMGEEAINNLRESWKATQGGPDNFGAPLILEEGMVHAINSIPPDDCQFLETRQHNVTEVSRWYRVPPHMLADLSRATFSNIEQQSLDFVIHTLRPWFIRVERAIKRQLLDETEQQVLLAEFLVDALLRGDQKTRTDSLRARFLSGNICQDEWREIENLNPLPDGMGQIYVLPLNLTTVERMIAGDVEPEAEPDPAEDDPAKDAPDEKPDPQDETKESDDGKTAGEK